MKGGVQMEEGHDYLISTIDLNDQKTVEMELIRKGGNLRDKKTVRYDDFLTIVNDREVYSVSAVLPKLPENTFLVKYSDANSYSIVIYVPKGKRLTDFLDQDMNVCYPPLLFGFRIRDKRIMATSVYAVTEEFEQLTPECTAYSYPYGNVSAMTGSVCWGNTPLPDIDIPYDLNKVLWMFFSARTNNHLWGGNANAVSLDELYLKMSKAEEFDNSLLARVDSIANLFKI